MTQSENNNQTSSLKLLPYEHNAKYYETDQMGIVHHSNYIRWMEEARMDMMKQLGIPYRKMEEEGIISPVVSVSCEYRSMTHFSDTVLIETKITKYNGIRLDLEYKITDSSYVIEGAKGLFGSPIGKNDKEKSETITIDSSYDGKNLNRESFGINVRKEG